MSGDDELKALAENHGAEKVLALLCPEVFDTKRLQCKHEKFWFADSGLCWCSGCGGCFNERYERLENSLPKDHVYFETRRVMAKEESKKYEKGYWSGNRWYPSF